MNKITSILALLAIAGKMLVAGGDIAPVEPIVVEEESGLKQKLSIYALIPSLDGSYIVNLPDDSSSDGTDFIDKLDMAFMASYELRDEKWLFYTDFLYVDMSDDHNVYSPYNNTILRSETEFKAWMLSAYGGYNMFNDGDGSLDIIAGMRWLSLNIDLSLRSAPFYGADLSPSFDYFDAVIGVKGHRNINENWYLPYMFDVGAGDSQLTYQAIAGVGYRYDWGDVLLTYRYISYDNNSNGVELIHDLQLYGPQIGVIWQF
jgi:hypothetical protein